MLGPAADRFMLNQMRERVIAHPSNSASRSMVVPDRERPGTAHVTMKNAQMPGPQRQVSSDWMPGMGEAPPLPKPPSTSHGSPMPGMGWLGDINLSTGTVVGLAAVAGAVWYLSRRK